MSPILARAAVASFRLLSRLPLWALYGLSDIAFPIVYWAVRYRRDIVARNLARAFPEKSRKARKSIEIKYYRWLCDYAVETIKLLTISPKTMLRYIEFRGAEQLEERFDRGQDCAAILGHYCNWEWLSATGLAMTRHKDAVMGLIYHPLYNHFFDRLFIDLRSHLGGVPIPKKDILRYLVGYRRDNRRNLFGYIADQSPKWDNIHLWLPFLNQDTPVFTGGERIMRKVNNAVFYVDMQRPRRGKYICTFVHITDDPASLPADDITVRFFRMLEQTIQRQPHLYLWSHNRWKRQRN